MVSTRYIWELKFAFLPKKCKITNKIIWLSYGYRCRSYYRSGDFIHWEDCWHDFNQHLIWALVNEYDS